MYQIAGCCIVSREDISIKLQNVMVHPGSWKYQITARCISSRDHRSIKSLRVVVGIKELEQLYVCGTYLELIEESNRKVMYFIVLYNIYSIISLLHRIILYIPTII